MPERYRVDASLVQFNTVESGLLLPSACVVGDDGFLIAKRCGEGEASVSAFAFADVAACVSALAFCRGELLTLGFERWRFGGERRHFFPGAPEDVPWISEALRTVGMEEGGPRVFDVERDLEGYSPPCEPSAFVRRCSAADGGVLDRFLRDEFPGRWHADVMEKFSEEPHRAYVLVLDGRVAGFAMTQMEGDMRRRSGAVWSASLGPGWAALGPIGVAADLRGRGHGHGLLAAALCDLRDQGARRTIIDWTTLTAFYGQHGFVAAREYATFAGRLSG
jgi:GNAT superfamily N-acetyltransferase